MVGITQSYPTSYRGSDRTIGQGPRVARPISYAYSFKFRSLRNDQTWIFLRAPQESFLADCRGWLMPNETRGDDSHVPGNRACPIVRNSQSDRTNHACEASPNS